MQSQATATPSGVLPERPAWRLVDLSLPLAEHLPCSWPGHIQFRSRVLNYFVPSAPELGEVRADRGPYFIRSLVLDEHTGTHFDAPCHSVPPPSTGLPHAHPAGDITSDAVDLHTLIGTAVIVDARETLGRAPAGESPPVDVDLLEKAESAIGRRVQSGDVVIVRTDWDRHYLPFPDGSRYAADPVAGRCVAWPAPTVSFVDLLRERGVRCVATDAPSIAALQDPGPVHERALSAGLSVIEGLGNLGSLAGVPDPLFVFLPLPVLGGSGAPGRAVALISPTSEAQR